MGKMTSIHFSACHMGTADGHNLRTKAYLENCKKLLEAGQFKLNFDLLYQNAFREYYHEHPLEEVRKMTRRVDRGYKLEAFFEIQKKKYKEFNVSTRHPDGREMNLGTKEVTMRGDQKKKKVNVCVPISEAVVVCDERTTIDDIERIGKEIERKSGFKLLQVALHRDEGHYKDDIHTDENWIPNYHAHLVFDRMAYEKKIVKKVKIHQSNKKIAGLEEPGTKEKVIKPGQFFRMSTQDCRELQDICARILGMERGQEQGEKKKKHLTRDEFVQEVKRKESELAKQEQVKKSNEETISEQEKVIAQNIQNIHNLSSNVNHQMEQVERLRQESVHLLANAKEQAAAAATEWQRSIVKENDELREEMKTLREENSKIKRQGVNPKLNEYVESLQKLAEDTSIYKTVGKKTVEILMEVFNWFKEGIEAIINFTNRAGRWDSFSEKESESVKNCLVHQVDDWAQTTEEAKRFLLNAAQTKDERAWNLQVRHEVEAAERDASLEITRSERFSRGR